MQRMINLFDNTRLMVERGRLRIEAKGLAGVFAVVIIIFLVMRHLA